MDFSTIYKFILLYWNIIIPTLFILGLISYSWANWEQVKFKLMCFWMGFPFIGRITRLSKSLSTDKYAFSSENELCSDFYSYYDRYNKDTKHYKNCKSYLSKVDEIGRKPFPIILWIIVFALVILEALGFAYVLAGFTLPGASENLQQQGAMGIALIISIILVGFTHWTGFEVYKNSVIKKIRVMYANNKEPEHKLQRDTKITLETNELDDDKPAYNQMANRIHTNATYTTSWIISIITAIFIIVIAIGATYVRGQVLEKQLIEDIENSKTSAYMAYPSEMVESQKDADTKVVEQKVDSERKGGWATFIVLAILFIFIQLLGILFGYKWGFVGKESRHAYDDSFNFRSESDYERYFKKKKEAVEKLAQKYLKKLQHKMAQVANEQHPDGKVLELIETTNQRNFLDYVLRETENSIEKYNQINKVQTKEIKSEKTSKEYQTPTRQYNNQEVLNNEIKTTFCSECGTKLDIDSNFCGSCGNKIIQKEEPKVLTCPECGETYEDNTKFCAKDGIKLELI